MLEITVDFVHEFFDEDAHEFIFVEDVAALERTLDQFICALSDGKAMLAKVSHGIFGVVDHIGRRVRTQEVVHDYRFTRDLLALNASMASCVLRTA